MAAGYYTLVSSLPKLPHFESAEYLPLSRKQLEQRLSMLSLDDSVQLRLAEGLVRWQRQPITRTSQQVIADYQRLLPHLTHPALREFVEYRMTQRTALVALRRRRRGLGPPRWTGGGTRRGGSGRRHRHRLLDRHLGLDLGLGLGLLGGRSLLLWGLDHGLGRDRCRRGCVHRPGWLPQPAASV